MANSKFNITTYFSKNGSIVGCRQCTRITSKNNSKKSIPKRYSVFIISISLMPVNGSNVKNQFDVD